MPPSNPHDAPLEADEAQQVLRRAAELDASLGARLSVESLRAIASEAGIAPIAFERALQEERTARKAALESASRGVLGRLRLGLEIPVAQLVSPHSLFDWIARSVLASGLAWGFMWGAIELTRRLGIGSDGVRLRFAPEALGLLLAAGIAERLRARGVTVVLLGFGGALGVRFVVEQVSGARAVIGETGAISLLGAGVVGVLSGLALASRRTMTGDAPRDRLGTFSSAETGAHTEPPSREGAPQSWQLRLSRLRTLSS